jgi:glutathione S-transferase
VEADIERVVAICNERAGGSPWLFGAFSGADIMLAPIATRFQTYGVHLEGRAKAYMDRLLAHPLVAEWLRLGREEVDVIPTLEIGQ